MFALTIPCVVSTNAASVNALPAMVTVRVDPPIVAPRTVKPSKRKLLADENDTAIDTAAPGSGQIVTTAGLQPPPNDP